MDDIFTYDIEVSIDNNYDSYFGIGAMNANDLEDIVLELNDKRNPSIVGFLFTDNILPEEITRMRLYIITNKIVDTGIITIYINKKDYKIFKYLYSSSLGFYIGTLKDRLRQVLVNLNYLLGSLNKVSTEYYLSLGGKQIILNGSDPGSLLSNSFNKIVIDFNERTNDSWEVVMI